MILAESDPGCNIVNNHHFLERRAFSAFYFCFSHHYVMLYFTYSSNGVSWISYYIVSLNDWEHFWSLYATL